jgi:hypothetical protein
MTTGSGEPGAGPTIRRRARCHPRDRRRARGLVASAVASDGPHRSPCTSIESSDPPPPMRPATAAPTVPGNPSAAVPDASRSGPGTTPQTHESGAHTFAGSPTGNLRPFPVGPAVTLTTPRRRREPRLSARSSRSPSAISNGPEGTTGPEPDGRSRASSTAARIRDDGRHGRRQRRHRRTPSTAPPADACLAKHLGELVVRAPQRAAEFEFEAGNETVTAEESAAWRR